MPVLMKVLRSASSPLRSCQGTSAKTMVDPLWSLVAGAKDALAQSSLQTSVRTEATGSPQTSGESDETLDGVKKEKACRRAVLLTNPLTALWGALFLVMSFVTAGAQIATTTTLAVSPTIPAANGSVFTMTATVAGSTTPAAGTVTFRDTYNSITHVLGTVQVQSGNGGSTKGKAVLMQELGGIGTHSIVATFNAPKAYLTSSSATQSVTTTGLYPTTASLVQSGGSLAAGWNLTATIVGIGSLNLSPTGNVSLLDTSNSNLLLGIAGLGGGTYGQQTVAGS